MLKQYYNGIMSSAVYQFSPEQAEVVHFYDFYRSALLGHRYNAYKSASVRWRINYTELIAAVTSSGAVVTLPFWALQPWKTVFLIALLTSALASIIRTVFGWSQDSDLRSRLCSSWLDLYLEMENVLNRIRSHGHIADSDKALMDLLCERFRKLNSLDSLKSDDRLMLRLQDDIDKSIPPESLWLPAWSDGN